MNIVNLRAFGGLIFLIVALAFLLFIPVWTFDYWQAWVFLVVFSLPVLFITIYLMKNDPALLERRVSGGPKAEKEKSQKIIQSIAQFAFILVIVLPSFDQRFGWSQVSLFVTIFGDFLVVFGLYIVFLVFKENTFTSAIIDVEKKQTVITTGPYAIVRHPMYLGAIIMLIGTPIALGSWWGLLTVIPISIVILLRLLDEEKVLKNKLQGYKEYCKNTKYHLVPLIW